LLFGISPEGIGFNGMLLNIMCGLAVSKIANPPPLEVQNLVDDIPVPAGAGIADQH